VVLIARGRKAFDGTVDEARAAAPRTLVLEGDIDPAAVRALPGVTDVSAETLDGRRRFSAALAADSNGQAPLQAAFAQGLDVVRFELKEPSLHDAFLVLAGEEAA